MCERYDHRQMSLFSAEVSPVRTSAQQERALASQGHVQGFGMSSDESPKRSGRRSSSSKTSPAVPGVGCPTCGETCTCWGTELVPTRYLPATSERRTCDGECSLWPTSTVCGNHNRKGASKNSGTGLATAALYPTPTASDGNGAGSQGREGGSNLRTAVMYPTPAARDYRSASGIPHGRHTPNLPEFIAGRLGGETAPDGRHITALSPWFVEALMGFPDGWTSYHLVKPARARGRKGGHG
jgi:hypothetical protein